MGTPYSVTTYYSSGPYTTRIDNFDGSGLLVSREFDGFSGRAYTSELIDYSAAGAVTEQDFTGYTTTGYAALKVTYDGSGQETGYTELNASGGLLLGVAYGSGGASTVTSTYTTRAYTTQITQYAAGGHLASVEYDGFTGGGYTTEVVTYDAGGDLVSADYTAAAGTGYASVTYNYATGGQVTSVAYDGFTGRAYTGETISYAATGGITELRLSGYTGTSYAVLDITYDGSGHETGYTEFDAGGHALYALTYGAAGAYSVTSYSSTGGYASTTADYDGSGHQLSVEYNGLTGRDYTSKTYTYDPATHALISVTEAGFTDQPYTSEIITYDAAGHTTSLELDGYQGYTSEPIFDVPYSDEIFTYNASGQVVTQTYVTSYTGYDRQDTLTYDASGHLTSAVSVNIDDGVTYSTSYYYDASGTETETVETGPGQFPLPYVSGTASTLITYPSAPVVYSALGTPNVTGYEFVSQYQGVTGTPFTSATITSYGASNFTPPFTATVVESGFTGGAYTSLRLDYVDYTNGGVLAAVQTEFNNDGTLSVSALRNFAPLTDTSASETFNLGSTFGDSLSIASAAFGADTIIGAQLGDANVNDDTAFVLSTAVFANFADLYAHAASSGSGDTLITRDAGDTLLLKGVTLAEIAANPQDFHFVTTNPDGSYSISYSTPPSYGETGQVITYTSTGLELSREYDGLTSAHDATSGYSYTSTVIVNNPNGGYQSVTESGFSGVGYTSQRVDYFDGEAATKTFFNTDGTHTVTALEATTITDTPVSETFNLIADDTFALTIPNFGVDTINGYTPGQDSFDISHTLFANFAALEAAATASGADDTLITYDAQDTLLLVGVTPAQLAAHSSDFHFI